MDNLKNNSFINIQVNYLLAERITLSATISTLQGTISELQVGANNAKHDLLTMSATISTLQGKVQHRDRFIIHYKQRIVDLEQALAPMYYT